MIVPNVQQLMTHFGLTTHFAMVAMVPKLNVSFNAKVSNTIPVKVMCCSSKL